MRDGSQSDADRDSPGESGLGAYDRQVSLKTSAKPIVRCAHGVPAAFALRVVRTGPDSPYVRHGQIVPLALHFRFDFQLRPNHRAIPAGLDYSNF